MKKNHRQPLKLSTEVLRQLTRTQATLAAGGRIKLPDTAGAFCTAPTQDAACTQTIDC
jgi:hypothetical protein